MMPKKETFAMNATKAQQVELLNNIIGNQNLYVSYLPKRLDEVTVRRVFARFGKISSIKFISKPIFTTNIAYVAFFNSVHASRAKSFVCKEQEFKP